MSASKDIDPSRVKGLSSGTERARLPCMIAATGPGAMYVFIEAIDDEGPDVALTVSVYKLPTLSEYADKENLDGSTLVDLSARVLLPNWTVHAYLIAAKDAAQTDGLAADRMVSGVEAVMVR